jgi:hypothetical protein
MSLTMLWRWAKALFAPSAPYHFVRWVPIEWAVRLRTLQQGVNNVGNTRQNVAALTAAAKAEANGNAVWARWNPVLPYKLQVDVKGVPGYVTPPNY